MNTLDYLREQHRLDGQKNPLAFDKLIDRVLVVLNPCSESMNRCEWCNVVKECRKLFDRLC